MKNYIISDPKILGGKHVIAGTRIPISRILFLLKDGYTVEAIHDEYPDIEIEILKGAIDEAVRIIDSNRNASLS